MGPFVVQRLFSAAVVFFMLCGKGVDGRSLLAELTRQQQDICLEPSCVLASASILRALNTSADPCQDFFQYSCGGWLEDNDIPVGQSAYSRFEEVGKRNSRIIRELLERDSNIFNGKESEAVQKAKNFYNACMNMSFVDEAGGRPLKEVISLLGGWSLLDYDDLSIVSQSSNIYLRMSSLAVTSGELLDTLVTSHKLAASPLFNMWVTVDDKNSSANIISFEQDGLQLLSPDLYNDTLLRDAYVKLGAATALHLKFGEHFNPEEEKVVEFYSEAMEQMKGILAFETKLAKAFVPTDDLQDPEETYHKMTITQLSALIPFLNVSSYLKEVFGHAIPDDENVLVYTPDYFTRLNDILQEFPERVIKDYIVWHTTYYMLPFLSTPFRQAMQDFEEKFKGSSGGSVPLWLVCVRRTQEAMEDVTGALFVQEHIPHKTKKEVEEILQTIREAFVESLPTLSWMEKSTKAKAREKALAMADRIGWPDWLLDPEALDEKLQKVMVDPSDQFLNMIWGRRYSVEENLYLRGKPVNKLEWDMGADVVNAWYNPSENQMVFPAGILQPPFYSPTGPMAVNYGGIGTVQGHELTHGFDDEGRKFDKFGNLNDWWDEKSAAQYEKRTQCMEEQYDNYKISDNAHVDGLLTLGENIADNGGIRAAFSAFKSWQKTKPGQAERRFPGLQDFSQEQLFFIGLAQVWCNKQTPESLLLLVLTNPHSPAQFRVKGMLSNMQEFAEVFQCPSGSPMNPEKKCRVW